jgi:hypothetical protein
LAAAYALLAAAWVVGDAPAAVPDEPANTVRAVGVGLLDWEGQRLRPGEGANQLDYDFTRIFHVPGKEVPLAPCYMSKPVSADCLRSEPLPAPTAQVLLRSNVGAYPPFIYLPAGLAMRLAQRPTQAGLLGRASFALICVLLLGLAAWLLDDGATVWPLAGLTMAVTPMVLFLSASVTPNGAEICGGICFAASLVAVARGRRTAGVWAALALSGATLSLSRPAGPALVLALLVATLPVISWRRAGRGALVAGLFLGAAMVAAAAWGLTHRSHTPAPPRALVDSLAPVLAETRGLLWNMIGVFGWQDTLLPKGVYWAYLGGVVGLTTAALLMGRMRERLSILMAILGAYGLAVGFYALVLHPTGFDLQGRYVMPVLVLVPLVAAAVLARSWRNARFAPFAVGVAVAALQVLAVWINSGRYGTGVGGSSAFLVSPQWAPPGGWLPVLAATLLAAVLMVLALRPGRAADPLLDA